MNDMNQPSPDAISELSAQIELKSEPLRRLIAEVGRVIVGQKGLIHRMLIGLARWRAPADRRGAGAGQDDRGGLPCQSDPHGFSAVAVHARSAARGFDWHPGLSPADPGVRGPEGTDLRQPDPGG